MSALRWRDRRKALFTGESVREAGSETMRRDWSARRQRPRRRIAWTPILAVGVGSLLAAAVAVREQRDPHKLRELATQLGFARPERVIDLSAPAERP